MQGCRRLIVDFALNILYGVVSGGRVHICTQCWGRPYQHLDKAACQLGLAGKGKGSSDMVLDWTKEKSALLKPKRIFSYSDLDYKEAVQLLQKYFPRYINPVRGQVSVINCQIGQLSDRTTVSGDNCQKIAKTSSVHLNR